MAYFYGSLPADGGSLNPPLPPQVASNKCPYTMTLTASVLTSDNIEHIRGGKDELVVNMSQDKTSAEVNM